MTPKSRLIFAITGLITFTGLVITLLALGQSAAAVGPLILAIVWGVQQLLQALDANRRNEPPRLPTALSPVDPQAIEGENGSTGKAA
ncbi:hypothetical protein [Streptomyces sp. NBC_01443]|uniref:hypothetical protein n=1 Tax=Streptomyces sp. NBC_01443 TaxID=2903868 RepID=UPI00224C8A52|nr:hypothetical protein [Streptomyces sp. NBC_01443]MCX4632688.1 hypothetical protein [Streptomyces sp. NBC_01443]